MPKPNIQPAITAYYAGLDSRIDAEVASDLGIPISPDDFASDYESGREVARLLKAAEARMIGSVLCGDCFEPAPCDHLGLKQNGNLFIRR